MVPRKEYYICLYDGSNGDRRKRGVPDDVPVVLQNEHETRNNLFSHRVGDDRRQSSKKVERDVNLIAQRRLEKCVQSSACQPNHVAAGKITFVAKIKQIRSRETTARSISNILYLDAERSNAEMCSNAMGLQGNVSISDKQKTSA